MQLQPLSFIFCPVMLVSLLSSSDPVSAILADLLYAAKDRQLEVHYRTTFTSSLSDAKNGSIYTEEYVLSNRRRIVVTNNTMEYNYYYDRNTSQYLTVERSLESSKEPEIMRAGPRWRLCILISPGGYLLKNCNVQYCQVFAKNINIMKFFADCTTTNQTKENLPDDLWIGLGPASRGYLRTVPKLLTHIRNKFVINQGTPTTIRGIPCERHDSETTIAVDGVHLNYTLQYYLSYETPLAYQLNDTAVPLRIVLSTLTKQDSANTSSAEILPQTTTVYDFTTVKLLGYRPMDFYNTPRGVVCKGRKRPDYSLPIPNQYSTREEVVIVLPRFTMVTHSLLYFDYKLNLTRMDIIQNDPNAKPLSVSFIHDVTNQLTYKRFLDNGTCEVEPLAPSPNRLLNWDIDYSNGTAQLRNLTALYSRFTLHYQGQRMIRDILMDVFTNLSDTEEIRSVTEFHVSVPAVKLNNFGDYGEHQSMMGFYHMSYNKTTNSVLREVHVNLFDTKIESLNYDVFDGEECFSATYAERRRLSITFYDQADTFSLGLVSSSDLAYQLRLELAYNTSVSPLRITDVQVYDSQKDKTIDVYFTLHAPAHVKGNASNGPDLVVSQLVIEEIEGLIKLRIEKGDFFFHFQDKNGKPRVLLATSMDTKAASPSSSSSSTLVKTYSSGEMAGLGIGMLLLGALIAVGVGAIVWVKRFDINLPYTRSE